MDPNCKKILGIDVADAKTQCETYFSPHVQYSIFKESTVNLIQSLYKVFSTGLVTGKTLTDFCAGPGVFHLLVIQGFIEEITFLELNDVDRTEIEKWKNKDPDAFDWSHINEIIKAFKGNREEIEDEEEKLRGKIVNVLKWDFIEDIPANLLSLPKADIATNFAGLEPISKNPEEYRSNLRKFSNLIKLDGYLVMFAAINASYVKVGEDTFHYLRCDESFYRKVLCEGGFEIKHWERFERKMIGDFVDHEASVFIAAQKVKEP